MAFNKMSYKDLQQECKIRGIKANGKKVWMIEQLSSVPSLAYSPTPSPCSGNGVATTFLSALPADIFFVVSEYTDSGKIIAKLQRLSRYGRLLAQDPQLLALLEAERMRRAHETDRARKTDRPRGEKERTSLLRSPPNGCPRP
mmetsp:Transcript_30166/g.60451  ORF Transcript_30166/g.60451 Transcript_30166/m.60451 type:complete len:143 (-) Transcript_30166:55-483(-)